MASTMTSKDIPSFSVVLKVKLDNYRNVFPCANKALCLCCCGFRCMLEWAEETVCFAPWPNATKF